MSRHTHFFPFFFLFSAPVLEKKNSSKYVKAHTLFFLFFPLFSAPVLEKKNSIKHVRALFSYEAAADIELDLKEGDVVKVDIYCSSKGRADG